MRPLILKCPSCDGALSVARLECAKCDIGIEGEFSMPPLLRLSPAQIDFVEVFIKNRGSIRDVERELGVSYPTVRGRLDDVIRALGYPVKGEAAEEVPPTESATGRRSVLADLKAGRISPEEALAALNEPEPQKNR
ncbi:MAG TPA: DUF2089 domain-containing protein [Candidatus Binataceae bacterium]|nr:DUF2089 domain-containing protein [Candidatus Binataceae bacterium]